MIPKCVVVRMDAGLSFANTRRLQEFCMRAINTASTADPSISHLILDCKSINGTDMTGCEAIENLAISLEKRKKSLVLANLKAPLTQAKGHWFLDPCRYYSTVNPLNPNYSNIYIYIQTLHLYRTSDWHTYTISHNSQVADWTESSSPRRHPGACKIPFADTLTLTWYNYNNLSRPRFECGLVRETLPKMALIWVGDLL